MNDPTPDPICSTINGRPSWVFEDGTVLPVVSGGSDVGLAATDDTGGDTQPPPDVDVPAADDQGEDEPFDFDAFDSELEQRETTLVGNDKALAETKRHRAQLKKLRERQERYQAIESLDRDSQQWVLQLVDSITGGRREVATPMLVELLDYWHGDRLVEVLEAFGLTTKQAEKAVSAAEDAKGGKAKAAKDDDEYDLTDPDQLARYVEDQFAKRDEKAKVEAQKQAEFERRVAAVAEKITADLKKLGYDDPRSPQAQHVVLLARHLYDNDLRKAHEALVRQSRGGQPAKGSGAEAPAAGKGQAPPPSPTTGQQDDKPTFRTREQILRDAEAKHRHRLDTAFGAPAS